MQADEGKKEGVTVSSRVNLSVCLTGSVVALLT